MDMQVVEPVGTDRHAIAVGQGGDTAEFADPAADGGVRLENGRRPLVEQLLEPPAAGLDLAGGHRDRGGGGQGGVAVDQIADECLLDKLGIE